MKFCRNLMICLLCTALVFSFIPNAAAVQNAQPAAAISAYDSTAPQLLTASNLYAQSAILVNGTTGSVIFEKNANLEMYPASTTKILTALLVLENCDLSTQVTISHRAIQTEPTWIPAMMGEVYTIEQLLYALMLQSANDAALALAEAVSGSAENFAALMNERAREIGCTNTNFTTPNGLPDSNHYTTASDMAKIACEAMKNETFRRMIATQTYVLPPTNKRSESVTLTNKNKFLAGSGDSTFSYTYGTGIKTGYTNAAQSTFVGAAEKDGRLLISVVFGTTSDGKWLDTQKLMDYGFSGAYVDLDILSLYNASKHTMLITGAEDSAVINGLLELEVAQEDQEKLRGYFSSLENVSAAERSFSSCVSYADYAPSFSAPIQAGTPMATMTFQAPFMEQSVTVTLVAPNDIAAKVAPTAVPSIGGNSTGDAQTVFFADNGTTTSKKDKLLITLMLVTGVFMVLVVITLVSSTIRTNRRRARRRKAAQARRAQQYRRYYQ